MGAVDAVSPRRQAREAAVDALVLRQVFGAPEWARTGDPALLSRAFREQLQTMAARLAPHFGAVPEPVQRRPLCDLAGGPVRAGAWWMEA